MLDPIHGQAGDAGEEGEEGDHVAAHALERSEVAGAALEEIRTLRRIRNETLATYYTRTR